jgi:predicted GTPase
MILLNKIDIVDVDKNKIDELYNAINYDLLGSKHFLVKDISALKNIRLEESIKWLFNAMMDHVKDEGFDEEANSYINLV